MCNYIAIDGGTTNTRVYLVSNGKTVQKISLAVGAAKSIDGNALLKEKIRTAIQTLLSDHHLTGKEIRCILACGMITCEFGLMPLEHIRVPAGLCELSAALYSCVISEITDIPFVFFRGVKTLGDRLENTDMMRGEETEVMGIFCGAGLYVLPGSHSKIISVDQDGRILDFKTMLTGEMLFAIASDTILRDAVSLREFPLDPTALFEGYAYAKEHGLNEALFKVRILKNCFGKTDSECYHFCLGAILCDEITCLLESKEDRVIIGGKKAIRNAMASILRAVCEKEIVVLPDEKVNDSLIAGMIKIYESKIQEKEI